MSRNRKNSNVRVGNNTYWTSIQRLMEEAFAVKPNEVNGQYNIATMYYVHILRNIVKGRFKIICPDWWSTDFMLDLLIDQGKFYITETPLGITPLQGSSNGQNVFLRPNKVTLTNPVLNTLYKKLFPTLSKGNVVKPANVAVIYFYDDKTYQPLFPSIHYYANQLANIDASLSVNFQNTRVAYIFNASNSRQEAEAKLIYDKISRGEPAVFAKVKDPMNPQDGGLDVSHLPVKDMYIADKLLEAKQAIISEFLTIWGLNSTAYEKKERLIVDEVNGNNDYAESMIKYPQDNLKKCTEQVNKLFPEIDFSISIESGEENEQGKTSSAQDIHEKVN